MATALSPDSAGSQARPEQAIVIGGSITGLTAALALAEKGFEVTVVERDPTPSASIGWANSGDWTRRGARHAMQPHVLTARLRNALHAWYPGLVQALLGAGVWEQRFEDTIHPLARSGYRAPRGAGEVTTFIARRTTLELAMRRYVEAQSSIRLLSGVRVTSLIVDTQAPIPSVRGVCARDASGDRQMRADLVVDASGRSSRLFAQLETAGVEIAEEHRESHSIYHTRHYRLRPGKSFPGLYGLPGAAFGDMTIAALPGDNGGFTVTIGAFKDDPLLSATPNEAVFDRICRETPRVASWTDGEISEPTSPIMSWANMDFMWRSLLRDRAPQVLGYFLAGDTALRSNPKYGRGCTCGVIGSRLLAEALAATADQGARLRIYEQSLRRAFRAEWEALLKIDAADYGRFRLAAGLDRPSLAGRAREAFQHHLLNRAMLADPHVQRALMRGFYGLEAPTRWMRHPSVWLRVARAAILPRRFAKVVRENAQRPTRADIRSWIEARAA